MHWSKIRIPLFTLLSAAILFGGCAHRPQGVETPGRGAGMVVRKTAPPRPAMVWVSSGSFRPAQRTPADVTAIVIHTTEGRYDPALSFAENQANNYRNTIQYFKRNDRNVSTHFMLGPKGEICQMVKETDIAFTQTYYNGRSIGIECAGWSGRPETWTPELMEALVNLTAHLCVEWGVAPYHPRGTAYEGPNRVVLANGDQRFTGEGLVGHFQIQPWNKTDPGPHFPWAEFSQRVREKIREAGQEPRRRR